MSIELEQEPHADYLKGYNDGYLLQQEMPQLTDILAKSLDNIESERAAGFKAGRQQYELEQDLGKDKEPEPDFKVTWMQPLPDDYDDISPEQDMDKDDMDLEKE